MLSLLFGSELREKILLYLMECGEGYGLELAHNFKASLFAVQSQTRRLEEAGILVSRTVGKTRLYSINPRYFLQAELIALLKKDFQALPEDEIRKHYRPHIGVQKKKAALHPPEKANSSLSSRPHRSR